jgi:hypothetical protein
VAKRTRFASRTASLLSVGPTSPCVRRAKPTRVIGIVSRNQREFQKSRDIFVQDLPPGVVSVEDIPDNFVPRMLGVTRSQVVAAVQAEKPKCDVRDPSWILIEESGVYYIEVNLGTSESLESFAFHVRGGGEAEQLIRRILERLNLRALDSESEFGVFARDGAHG